MKAYHSVCYKSSIKSVLKNEQAALVYILPKKQRKHGKNPRLRCFNKSYTFQNPTDGRRMQKQYWPSRLSQREVIFTEVDEPSLTV